MTADAAATHRAALWLSLMLTVLGSCGGCNGMRQFEAGPIPSAERVGGNDKPGSEELAELAVVAARIFIEDPNRRPLALANMILSGMLVAGGFLVGMRHRSARWFVINVLVANLLWIVADGLVETLRLLQERQTLATAIVAWLHAAQPPGPSMTVRDEWSMAHAWVTSLAVAASLASAASFVVHAIVLHRARSPMIARFLSEGRG